MKKGIALPAMMSLVLAVLVLILVWMIISSLTNDGADTFSGLLNIGGA